MEAEEIQTPPEEDKMARYVNWLHENGCKFPRVEYPAYCGPYGILGAKAKMDIPPNTSFLFV
jgi:hypothetical protein